MGHPATERPSSSRPSPARAACLRSPPTARASLANMWARQSCGFARSFGRWGGVTDVTDVTDVTILRRRSSGFARYSRQWGRRDRDHAGRVRWRGVGVAGGECGAKDPASLLPLSLLSSGLPPPSTSRTAASVHPEGCEYHPTSGMAAPLHPRRVITSLPPPPLRSLHPLHPLRPLRPSAHLLPAGEGGGTVPPPPRRVRRHRRLTRVE